MLHQCDTWLIGSSKGHFHGSVFVDIHARVFLEGSAMPSVIFRALIQHYSPAFLQESDYIDDLDHIIRCFNKMTKPRFRNAESPQYIKFGSTRDNDRQYNIRLGQLKLQG